MKRPMEKKTAMTTARTTTSFSIRPLPSFFSSQRSNLEGSAVSSSG